MYQFYYADSDKISKVPYYNKNIAELFEITAVRPTMWEEHCLECAAPACYGNCLHYIPRIDGRCMRFENGLYVYPNEKACCKQGVRVKFRKWANMMTIIFPAMLDFDAYSELTDKNQKLGNRLSRIATSKMPVKLKWETIRSEEYIRRRRLRKITGLDNTPDAFVFHGFSFEEESFNLIIEIYDKHTPVFKTSIKLSPGENINIIDNERLSKACRTPNFLVKVYPENDIEAELDILWCDFVKGRIITTDEPANKVKCVVWDLDNTLWNGTLIETDNTKDLRLNPKVLDTIKSLDERGIIQSIASKNDYEPAWSVINDLGISDYFIYPQIHWNAKSGSMEQIAKNLNIGIDSLALIDDSQYERNQVQSVFPQIRTYDVSDIEKLMNKPEFDVMITEESKKRRLMYKAEEKRNALIQSADNGNVEDFLRNCNLQIELFEPVSNDEKLRCFELLVRTNQLNLSGKKYSPEEYNEVLKRTNHRNMAFSCKDDFGSYGIVGFLQYKIEDNEMVITEFAMSCRVAGKYIESALFSFLLENENISEGKMQITITQKNRLLRKSLAKIGFTFQNQDSESVTYLFNDKLLNKDIAKAFFR